MDLKRFPSNMEYTHIRDIFYLQKYILKVAQRCSIFLGYLGCVKFKGYTEIQIQENMVDIWLYGYIIVQEKNSQCKKVDP